MRLTGASYLTMPSGGIGPSSPGEARCTARAPSGVLASTVATFAYPESVSRFTRSSFPFTPITMEMSTSPTSQASGIELARIPNRNTITPISQSFFTNAQIQAMTLPILGMIEIHV